MPHLKMPHLQMAVFQMVITVASGLNLTKPNLNILAQNIAYAIGFRAFKRINDGR